MHVLGPSLGGADRQRAPCLHLSMDYMGKRLGRPGGGGEELEDLCEWGTEVQWGLTGGFVCEMCDFCHHWPSEGHQGPFENSVPCSHGLGSMKGMVRLSLDSRLRPRSSWGDGKRTMQDKWGPPAFPLLCRPHQGNTLTLEPLQELKIYFSSRRQQQTRRGDHPPA